MFAAFSDDAAQLLTSDGNGFRMFSLPPVTPGFAKVRDCTDMGPVTLLSVLPDSDIAAIVGPTAGAHGHGRRLRLYDMVKDEELTEMFFEAEILGVRMNVKRLAIIIEKHTHLFDLATLQPLPQIRTSHPPNTRGLGSLSCLGADTSCYFAFSQSVDSGTDQRGDVLVLEAIDAATVTVITAHRAPVVALEFSPRGDALVTASRKGNVVRVFAIPDGQPMYAFRRGQAEALIYSVALSADLSLCAAIGDTGTLHVFRSADKAAGGTSAFSGEGARSFAKHPVRKQPGQCRFSDDATRLFVLYSPQRLDAAEPSVSAAPGAPTKVCSITRGVPIAAPGSGCLLQFEVERDKLRPSGEHQF